MQRFENKFDLLKSVHENKNLKKGTVSLFQYLVYKSNDNGCFPSVETIAQALGCCVRTVQYNMRKLEKEGYVIRKERWYEHQQLSNKYEFNFGVIDEDVPEQKSLIMKTHVSGNPNERISKMKMLGKIYASDLNLSEKLVFSYLCYRANSRGFFYGTRRMVTKDVGMRVVSFYNVLLSLSDKKMIKIECQNNRGMFTIQISNKIMTDGITKDPVQIAQDDILDQCDKKQNDMQHIQLYNLLHKNRLFRGMRGMLQRIRLFLLEKVRKRKPVIEKSG